MKKALKAMQNCCGAVDLSPFGGDAQCFLRGVRDEMSALIEVNLVGREALVDHLMGFGRANAKLSAHAVLDEDAESAAIDPVFEVQGTKPQIQRTSGPRIEMARVFSQCSSSRNK